MALLDENLIVLNADVETADDCIRLAGDLFQKYGYVNEGYADMVIAREKEFATGLPGKGINIAIPHTNGTLVNKPTIGVIIPQKPVQFCEMGTHDTMLDCEVVIPIVIKDSHQQIDMLGKLMKLIQNGEKLRAIKNAQSKEEIMELLKDLDE